MKYRQVYEGEWIAPVMRRYKMMCCDCRLVHNIDFRILKDKRGQFVIFRAFRNNRATALARRNKKGVK